METTVNKKIFVAGNGPSLRDVNFSDLKSIDWLGMNAAYRYWDEVGIYPTYYCCLDKVVVKEHAHQIKRLLDDKKIKSAFLIRAVLDVTPELENYSSVYFLEDLLVSKKNEAKIFRTPFSSKKTTGSWAIRFVIYLGYKEIFISGIDCNYVEIVSGAKLTGNDLELQIEDDSKDNPNYFFKGYQKSGDKYQIPNPESHFGNMHLQSLEAVALDLFKNFPDVQVFNTAKNSNLFKYDVFPFIPVNNVFSRSSLDAIVIPLIKAEVDVLLRNFELWSDRGFQPITLSISKCLGTYIHAIFDCSEDKEITKRLETSFYSNQYLKSVFAGLRITFLEIPSKVNFYLKDNNVTDRLRKSGPNVHALATFESLSSIYHTIYYMEVDNTPVKQGWLKCLSSYCENNEFLIAGSMLSDIGNIDPALSMHLNGNALYRIGDSRFRKLLNEFFYPALEYLICERGNNHIAYDCVISVILSLTLSSRLRRDLGEPISPSVRILTEKLQPFLRLILPVSFFINIPPGSEGAAKLLLEKYLVKQTEALVIHNKVFNDEVHLKRQELFANSSFNTADELFNSKFKNSHFSYLSDNQLFPFHNFNTREGLRFEYLDYTRGLLILSGDDLDCKDKNTLVKGASVVFDSSSFKKGSEVSAKLEVICSESIEVELRLARHGEGAFCQAYKKVKVEANKKMVIALNLYLKENYQSIRLVTSPQNEFNRLTLKFLVADGKADSLHKYVSSIYKADEGLVSEIFDRFKSISARLTSAGSGKVFVKPDSKSPESTFALQDLEKSIYPKVLVVDSTLVGSGSATGQIKTLFFKNWPKERLYQVYLQDSELRGLFPFEEKEQRKIVTEKYVNKAIDDFNPDVIYFRATEHVQLFDLVDGLVSKGIPLVTHMMDDWPTRLSKGDPEVGRALDFRLRNLFKQARVNFSICDRMSEVYVHRYNEKFVSLANGVNLSQLKSKDWSSRPPISDKAPITIRYMGGVADDMNFDSVIRFSKVIEKLSKTKPIIFEIYTMSWYQVKLIETLKNCDAVKVRDLVPIEEYYACLTGADGLLLAYNFDKATLDYVGLSFANKLPEILASGVPGIFIGHPEIPTIEFAKDKLPKYVLSNDDSLEEDIMATIDNLFFNDADRPKEAGAFGREIAENEFRDSSRVKLALHELNLAAASPDVVDISDPVQTLKKANDALRQRDYILAFKLFCILNSIRHNNFAFWSNYCLSKILEMRAH